MVKSQVDTSIPPELAQTVQSLIKAQLDPIPGLKEALSNLEPPPGVIEAVRKLTEIDLGLLSGLQDTQQNAGSWPIGSQRDPADDDSDEPGEEQEGEREPGSDESQ